MHDLFKRAKKGDEAAFVSLLEQYQDKIYRIAYTYFRNEQDALDILQEVSFKAYKNIKKIRKPEALSAWLTTVTANHCKNVLRKKSRETMLTNTEGTLSVTQDHDMPLILREVISYLSISEQTVILLTYFEGFTLGEIAQQTNTPIGTVKTRLNRALTKLRKQMRKEGIK
ncbi:RNA polymerase sigma-70 factor (ECF subfamily) [Pullulanibacillus pueri]|uniref:DNA-directed RNA polymerase sigma-70 factor n=1 Tax=Pullulanibacillus pueri TaxID=1437324 RepID=A0A8J2ZXS3_9BACL|nr:sigma-70 family RNA polymerase sigma factor [Pullulanibacillus pueri]MBM7683187.1 RNA polymerase sigma-70 factor (ECF subfamily) [Pullulanibacillus pueri]GGH85630.1 DNA-directed RNA polymerase sigma-70 factor [Pullulanibacillus pueri]